MPKQYYHLISREGDHARNIIEGLSLKNLVGYARGFAREGQIVTIFRGTTEQENPELIATITLEGIFRPSEATND